ncbi:MAG: hypothetical protein KBG08_08895 [Bacteroidales bacterium]|nr:hypothetical protein [Bacteroidales bacterium]
MESYLETNIQTNRQVNRQNGVRIYDDTATEAAFLLGGIGTGNISIGARGELKDWEIFNKPGKGNKLPLSFFSIYTRDSDGKITAKILESKIKPPYSGPHGYRSGALDGLGELAGLPRLDKAEMKVEYPFVNIDFQDPQLPVKMTLEAFTPFIPLNPEDSGIPCCIFRYKAKNITSRPVDATVAFSLLNVVGYDGEEIKIEDFSGNHNELRLEGKISGIYMYSEQFAQDHLKYGSLAILVPESEITAKPDWLKGEWWDGVQDFWDDFSTDGLLEPQSVTKAVGSDMKLDMYSRLSPGSIGIPATIRPGEEKEFVFILTWYFPNRIKGWWKISGQENETIRNHYALLFEDAWNVGRYVTGNLQRLTEESRKFSKALYNSSFPDFVLDAVSSNITVLRSNTCFWLENRYFFGWEGISDRVGSCHGSCTHVWNYAQTLAFLFPSLERSMRDIEFSLETDEEGAMAFRNQQVFGWEKFNFPPAADGQLGTIIRLYREWKISGDDSFLKKLWPRAKKAMDFAFSRWDTDGDFVLDGKQHNTYDIEFYGPNSMTGSMFYGALKAAAEMARVMGEPETARRYEKALALGSRRMDELLWNGEYYIQLLDDEDKYKYQYGSGCLSDQLVGQYLCHVTGLGYVLPQEHVRKAVYAVFKYNFVENFGNFPGLRRTYALNDEKGLVLCTWPKSGHPRHPMVYCDETWTGVEYSVAASLIYEGFMEEGLKLVKAVRDRYDGYKRNPWNEVECGHHYARSMASWAVLLALSGFVCDMPAKRIYFNPRINRNKFYTFWSTGTAWGTYSRIEKTEGGPVEHKLEVLYGNLDGIEVIVDGEVVAKL